MKFIILLDIFAWFDYEIWQMNVTTTLFNSKNEGISIWGILKTSYPLIVSKRFTCSKSSFKDLDKHAEVWFVKNPEELYVCMKISEGKMSFLVIYVDNIILIKNDIELMEQTKS